MKIEKTEITGKQNSYISVIERKEPFFQSPFHSHPEIELVYIKESFGKRIIGNSVEYFENGDMVLLGPDIPHVWLNDEKYYQGKAKLKAHSLVAYFNKDIFSTAFYELKETQKVNNLFNQATRGLLITGKTKTIVAKKLELLQNKKDFQLIVGLFEIISILAESKEFTFINKESYTPVNKNLKTDRLSEIYNYVKKNFKNDITLSEISKLANLTPQSFCRLFKSKTKKHFIEYLSEVRISNACRLLIETDMSISEIAYNCGYPTISNINKSFKKITAVTPKEYKKSTS